MARTTDLLALIRADWRRLIKWLLGGWAVFALVLLLALVARGRFAFFGLYCLAAALVGFLVTA